VKGYSTFAMLMNDYHLTKEDDQWKLTKENGERASKVFDGTKREAVKESADWLREKGGSLKIHKTDGKIQEERTYPRSADPKRSKG
jgi:hypothetical protein